MGQRAMDAGGFAKVTCDRASSRHCGCSSLSTGEGEDIAEFQYPCGPFFSAFEDGYQRNFLEWTSDGSQLVFNYAPANVPDRYGYVRGRAIWVADSEGKWVRMLVDANPGHVALFGFHAAVSPDGTRIGLFHLRVPDGKYRYIPRI